MNSTHTPSLIWDIGTAYDLFASQHVLHHAERFGLRASWAAGVRSRLAVPHRKLLEDAHELFSVPVGWLYSLPSPKDASTALRVLGQLPPANILPAIGLTQDLPKEASDTFQSVYSRHSWDDRDLECMQTLVQKKRWFSRPKELVNVLDWWSRADEFGERYLAALQAYQVSFFAEEERRIYQVLQVALEQAQEMAQRLDFTSLVERLTQGVHIAALEEAAEVILAPSFWMTPLVIYGHITPEKMLLLFGGRPPEASLVPGEDVPDAMLRALKALSDPTRLRVLRYLAGKPLSPSQLSQRLRLRAPTVIHHLNALRLAGLVYLSLDVEGEKRYAARISVVNDTYKTLHQFLSSKNEK